MNYWEIIAKADFIITRNTESTAYFDLIKDRFFGNSQTKLDINDLITYLEKVLIYYKGLRDKNYDNNDAN